MTTYTTHDPRPLQMGLIVLQADETIEADMRRLLPETVELLVSRVPSGTEVTPQSLARMEGALATSAGLFPRGAALSVVGYGCTSGTAQIGAAKVAAAIQSGVTTPHVTDPATALITACRTLGVTQIGLLSPYIASVSARLIALLDAAGITVAAFGSFDEAEEAKVVRIDTGSVTAAADAVLAQAPCEALFMSCTNLRTLGTIAAVEACHGVPVLTSNQVLAWDMLRLAGVSHDPGYGHLWRGR